jgi:hypothetical protein
MTDFAADLDGLLHQYTRWQIGHQDDPPAWVAVRRATPTRVHVLVAHDLADLRSKLASAEASTPGQTTASP